MFNAKMNHLFDLCTWFDHLLHKRTQSSCNNKLKWRVPENNSACFIYRLIYTSSHELNKNFLILSRRKLWREREKKEIKTMAILVHVWKFTSFTIFMSLAYIREGFAVQKSKANERKPKRNREEKAREKGNFKRDRMNFSEFLDEMVLFNAQFVAIVIIIIIVFLRREKEKNDWIQRLSAFFRDNLSRFAFSALSIYRQTHTMFRFHSQNKTNRWHHQHFSTVNYSKKMDGL